jgi:predicted site-specific integrase-resolvase
VPRKTLGLCARPSHDQRGDLERQTQVLELYCASQGWTFDIIIDRGSSMNYQNWGLLRLLDEILAGTVGCLVLPHQDRLLRFGAELVLVMCQEKEVDVDIINHGQDASFEEELASDVLEIITVFGTRLYGSRSHTKQKLIDGVRSAIRKVQC